MARRGLGLRFEEHQSCLSNNKRKVNHSQSGEVYISQHTDLIHLVTVASRDVRMVGCGNGAFILLVSFPVTAGWYSICYLFPAGISMSVLKNAHALSDHIPLAARFPLERPHLPFR
jgi:hypothetical protein